MKKSDFTTLYLFTKRNEEVELRCNLTAFNVSDKMEVWGQIVATNEQGIEMTSCLVISPNHLKPFSVEELFGIDEKEIEKMAISQAIQEEIF